PPGPRIDVPADSVMASRGIPAESNLASSRAIFAAATPNWLKRPAIRAVCAVIQSSGLKPWTSPTMWQSGGSFDASKSVGVLIPDRPASAAAQNFSTPMPMGETMPSPVITGCRFIGWPLSGGVTFPSENPAFTLAGEPVDEQVPASRLVE